MRPGEPDHHAEPDPAAAVARAAPSDEYGFHTGHVWYRGHFIARGAERTVSPHAITGKNGISATRAQRLRRARLGCTERHIVVLVPRIVPRIVPPPEL